MKKKGIITTVVIVAVILMLFVWVKNSYNGMVSKQEAVEAQWAQVENAYQRRADLIPNLVATVKGYAEHEQSTLREVIEARSKATNITVDPTNLDAEDIAKFQAAQDQLSGALSRLLVSIERYPDLKANQNFLELQSQLEGTENRITVERQKFNDAAKGYNQYIRQFPRNIISSMFDFEKIGYFKAASGSEVAPKVEF
ncbi:MAG: LemA family protein [Candidatus Limimorpha sp.]